MKNSTKAWAIVPAAGIGSRMQADIPKQYLQIKGQTVLQRTIERLANHPQIAGVVLAIAEDDCWWESIKLELNCPLMTTIGGKNRSDSVLNALKKLQSEIDVDPWVLVHDAARPCLRHEDIDVLLNELQADPVGGILAVPLTDTVKRVDADHTIEQTVNREGLWRAATPQMFRLMALSQAITEAVNKNLTITDEASAMEAIGLQPKVVQGHSDNIKITLPQDLALAELFLQQQAVNECV